MMLYGILSTRYSRLPQPQWSITDKKQAKRLENHLMRSAFYCLFISLKRKMLMHLSEIDGIVLACREEMMKKAGSDSL